MFGAGGTLDKQSGSSLSYRSADITSRLRKRRFNNSFGIAMIISHDAFSTWPARQRLPPATVGALAFYAYIFN